MSSSQASSLRCQPRLKDAIVFSGASCDSPRWASISTLRSACISEVLVDGPAAVIAQAVASRMAANWRLHACRIVVDFWRRVSGMRGMSSYDGACVKSDVRSAGDHAFDDG